MKRLLPVIVPAALLAACSPAGEEPAAPLPFAAATGVIMLTQDETPDAVMEALFDGAVVLDDAGCLRLDSPEPATVVWPKGFAAVTSGDTVLIRGAAGDVLGRVGDVFRLGGGYVTTLHDDVPVSDADRARALASCPGNYWIVGEIYR